MGQKIHPINYRLQVSKNWQSYWYTDFEASNLVHQDLYIRKYLEGVQHYFSVETNRIFIGRSLNGRAAIYNAFSQGGKNFQNESLLYKKLEEKLEDTLGMAGIDFDTATRFSKISCIIAQDIDSGFQKGFSTKQIFYRVQREYGGKLDGLKIICSGCFRGADRAQREVLQWGSLSPQTIQSNIDYEFKESYTSNGVYGIKVWVNVGEQPKQTVRPYYLDSVLRNELNKREYRWYQIQNLENLRKSEKDD